MLQIRYCIKDAKSSHRAASKDKYVDGVSFWQRAYEKSEAEQSRLLDRIYELEQRNTSLTVKLEAGSKTTSAGDGVDLPCNKRKRTNKASENRKRAKTGILTNIGRDDGPLIKGNNTIAGGSEDPEGGKSTDL